MAPSSPPSSPQSSHGPQLRSALPTDAASLADVFAESWRAAFQGIFPFEYVELMIRRRSADWWQRTMRHGGNPLLIEFQGVIAGYIHFGRGRYGEMDYGGEIYEIYIRPPFQGLGFGRRLFDGARQRLDAAGIYGLMAWSLEENHGCTGFYEALGGQEIGRSEVRFAHKWMPRIAYGWPPEGMPLMRLSGDSPEI